ncbi:hypothetical protein C8J56DRAFT_1039111 [Mycena floridula]|nr:hypothetical protein C8J56DRAFT_1039111 [Mycena floridula]
MFESGHCPDFLTSGLMALDNPGRSPSPTLSMPVDVDMGILPEPEADNLSCKTRIEKLGQVLALLSDLSMTPTEFLTLLLSSDEPQFCPYQTQLYAQRSDRLDELLDVIWESPGGRVCLEAWMMAGPTQEVVCADIRSKMESSKLAMLKDSDKVTIEDLAEFSINDMITSP